MNKLPDYVNCQNKTILVCPYYMHKICKETCAYARDVKGLGIGACCDGGLIRRIQNGERNQARHN